MLAIAAYTVFYIIWLAFPVGNDVQRLIIANIAFLLLSGANTLLCARLGVNRRLGVRVRRGWWILCAGFFMLTVGNVLYTYQELALATIPFPSLADGVFLFCYLLWLWGMLTFPTKAVTEYDKVTLWFDSGIVMLGFGSVLWVLVIQPTITAEYESWLGAVVSLAFPLGSLLLFFTSVTVIYRRPVGVSQSAFYWLGLSFFLYVTANTTYGYLSLQDVYYTGFFWTDSLFVLSWLAAVIAAQVQYWQTYLPEMATFQTDWPRRLRTLLPYVAVAIGYGMPIYIAHEQIDTLVGQMIIIAIGLTILLSLSQARAKQVAQRAQNEAEAARAALDDSAAQLAQANADLAQANADLEQRVVVRTADLEQALVAQRAQAAELRASIRLQEQLSATIVALSVPVIPVREDALIVPIIGVVDSQRAELLLSTILCAVKDRQRVRLVFLDLTGVALIDTASAQVIIQMGHAVRLVGAEIVLVGVRPELAQTLVELHMDLTQFRTVATLQQGLH